MNANSLHYSRRTPDYVQKARTTWRWACNIVSGLLAFNGVVLLYLLSLVNLVGLGVIDLLCFGLMALFVWRLRPGRNIIPRWYVEELARMGGEEAQS